MKPILLSKFRIPARRIAECLWGKGGTNSYKTNRKGAYYFSCSGHGGYIVDSRVLTTEEKIEINNFVEPENLDVYTQLIQNENYVVHVNMSEFTCRGKKWNYASVYGPPVENDSIKVYVFEEDCNWAILEKFTDIRIKSKIESEQASTEQIEKMFQWIVDYKKNKDKGKTFVTE